MKKRILEVKQMRTSFKTSKGVVEAIRGVDLHVDEGEILGIVGESGSGKSVTMKSVISEILSAPSRQRQMPIRMPYEPAHDERTDGPTS